MLDSDECVCRERLGDHLLTLHYISNEIYLITEYFLVKQVQNGKALAETIKSGKSENVFFYFSTTWTQTFLVMGNIIYKKFNVKCGVLETNIIYQPVIFYI